MNRIKQGLYSALAVATLVFGGLLTQSVADATAAPAPAPVHQVNLVHSSQYVYTVTLTGFAPSSEVTVFKNGQQQPQIYLFSKSMVFRQGVASPSTQVEIDIWNGQKRTYSYTFSMHHGDTGTHTAT